MPDISQLLGPLLWQGLLLSLFINLLFFFFALIKQSDHFTDITYSLSFITLSLFYAFTQPLPGTIPLIAIVLVVAWAVRLGGYLLLRIFWMGKDARFDHMRNKPVRFLFFWLLQALTVWVLLLPLYSYQSAPHTTELNILSALGILTWLLGLIIESVADMQKFTHKARNPQGKWLDQGLWHLSRHPNFFGEMLVWWGFYLIVIPDGWPLRILALVGPLFITCLLRFISGVPLLEKSAHKKYGHLPEYHEYRTRTRLLLPLPRLNKKV